MNNYFSSKKSHKFSNPGNGNANNTNNNNTDKHNSFNSSFQTVQSENDSDPNSKFISNILQQKHKNQFHANNNNNQNQNQHLINGNNISKLSLGSNMAPINGMVAAASSNIPSSQMKNSNMYNSFQQQDQHHNQSSSSGSQLKSSNKANALISNSNISKQQRYSSGSSDTSFNENNLPSNSNYSIHSKGSKNESNQLVDNNNNNIGNPYGFNVNSRHDSEKSFLPSLSSSVEEPNHYDSPPKPQSKAVAQSQTNVQSALTGIFSRKKNFLPSNKSLYPLPTVRKLQSNLVNSSDQNLAQKITDFNRRQINKNSTILLCISKL
jgi:hypothetical protein